MHLQITTEAIGKYSPEEMRKLAYEVMPPGISIGIREMIPSRKPSNEDIKIYQKLIEADTKIQHICYEPEDVDLLSNLLTQSKISKDGVLKPEDIEWQEQRRKRKVRKLDFEVR